MKLPPPLNLSGRGRDWAAPTSATSLTLYHALTPYCVCGRGCPRSECVTAKALSLALVVVPVGDVCGSEESLTGFFFALDACDLEELLGRVVQEPG